MAKNRYQGEAEDEIDIGPPTPEQEIEKILKRHSKLGRRKPKMMPADPFQAARWWMAHQEQPDEYREAVQKLGNNRYETPYHDRLCRTLRKFLRLKHIHQLYIVESIDRGIPWRGDDIDFFTDVVKEHDKMQAAIAAGKKDEYITEGFRKMRQTLRGMQA